MTRLTPAPPACRRALRALLAAVVLSGVAWAPAPSRVADPDAASPEALAPLPPTPSGAAAEVAPRDPGADPDPSAGGAGAPADPGPDAAGPPGQAPSIAYEETLAHEADRIDFTPGARPTVVLAQTPATAPETATSAIRLVSATGARDLPGVLSPGGEAAAAAGAAGRLRREVLGFLPYWELPSAAGGLDYATLSTIAYFSVGADAAGNLVRRNRDGTPATGWAGWTSAAMTRLINTAHAHGTRVVLTASAFAWNRTGAVSQRALLGSPRARANLVRQLVAAVRDRGADGVNLDFEPLVRGQEANFAALVRALRRGLDALRGSHQITFDTTGVIANYPLEAALGRAAADAVVVMGYDYRSAGSPVAGSIDPLSGPGFDLADTVRLYTARVSPSRVILAIPWYGRAWSTATAAARAATAGDAPQDASTAVPYRNIPALVARYGRRWDGVEQSPYVAYRRTACTPTRGCVTGWRQVWYDDGASLARRYQLVNDYGLRGAGIWALGYQGSSRDMSRALADAFSRDRVDRAAPRAGIRALPALGPDEGIAVAWSAADASDVRSYDVQVSVDGRGWSPWLARVTRTADVWLGADGHRYAFRVRATDARGNVGPWSVSSTSASAAAPARLAVGGFGRVALGGLAYRAGPSASAARLGSLPAGTLLAVTAGPVAAGGSTWYEVTGPIREWAPVSFVERGVWVAARTPTAQAVVPAAAPNATLVDAGITGFGFGGGGLVGTSPAALAGRLLSPNGDGSRDSLRVRWTATVALDRLTLNVLRPDGSPVGSVSVPTLTRGMHEFVWDGRVGGRRVGDGAYLLQLVGRAGGAVYRAPSAMPATAAQIARYGVVVDTVPPAVTGASASSALISPNRDGIRETTALALTAPGATAWTVRIGARAADPVRTFRGSGGRIAVTWDGRDDAGARVPDGEYSATLSACDAAGNCAARTLAVRVDTTPPSVVALAVPGAFSPDGDGDADTATLSWASSEPAGGTVSLWHGRSLVRRWSVPAGPVGSITWDGRSGAGRAVADGRYTLRTDLRDAAGNRRLTDWAVTVDRTAAALRWSGGFFPQDGDGLAATSTLSWRQTRRATTALALYDETGRLVREVWDRRPLGAGPHSWTWDGRLADGSMAPQGAYTALLTVTSPLGTQRLASRVWAAAFATSFSATTLRTGQALTVGLGPTERLRTSPRVTLRQPGRAPVTVTATRLADGTYRARFAVRPGPAGAASLRIAATDAAGAANVTVLALAMAR